MMQPTRPSCLLLRLPPPRASPTPSPSPRSCWRATLQSRQALACTTQLSLLQLFAPRLPPPCPPPLSTPPSPPRAPQTCPPLPPTLTDSPPISFPDTPHPRSPPDPQKCGPLPRASPRLHSFPPKHFHC